ITPPRADGRTGGRADAVQSQTASPADRPSAAFYILKPSADAILEQPLPLYVRNQLYRALGETAAAFLGAQRTAKKNATDTAVVIDHKGNGAAIRLTAGVQQRIGRNQVRAVAMTSTDGGVRGMEVVDTGKPITVPVGQAALGRILNVLGEPVDEGEPISPDAERWPIHRETPKFVDLEPKTEVFETGIKVIDLIAPFVNGGK